ncbi:MAG TPA: hypothetical protein VED22_06885 [Nitrososphaerales archaeon]|nr:hypothetical protein [Nitrososphaerales archaeon]
MVLVLGASETEHVLDFQTAVGAIYAELDEVVLREKPVRVGDEEMTTLESVVLATEYMAVPADANERFLASGVGRGI